MIERNVSLRRNEDDGTRNETSIGQDRTKNSVPFCLLSAFRQFFILPQAVSRNPSRHLSQYDSKNIQTINKTVHSSPPVCSYTLYFYASIFLFASFRSRSFFTSSFLRLSPHAPIILSVWFLPNPPRILSLPNLPGIYLHFGGETSASWLKKKRAQ